MGEPVGRALAVRAALLAWYDLHGRQLAWRTAPGGPAPDPYRVWLSEIMLQQTTVAAVGPYFQRFLDAFPTVDALARAPRDDVLRLWAGLGYYSRARNLHAAAQAVAAQGGFPETEEGLRALPGVGAYTAAAVAAIAFGKAANVVDGNVERVMARLHAVDAPLPGAKAQLAKLAAGFVDAERAGDWPQALMDLGATICTPKSPSCDACPVSAWCAAFASSAPTAFPRRATKPTKPERFGAAFVLLHTGHVLTVRRPDTGLLGGMIGLPTTAWRDGAWEESEIIDAAPQAASWARIGAVRHVFTHFALTLHVYRAEARSRGPGDWIVLTDAPNAGLPTLFAKAVRLAL